jgi:Na+/melibiose symporter-like transporter
LTDSPSTEGAAAPGSPEAGLGPAVIGKRELMAVGVNGVASQSVAQAYEGQLLYFTTNALGLPIALAGYLSLIVTFWDAVNDPLVGHIANNRVFKSGERIRPYFKWFTPFFVIFGILVFTVPDLPIWGKFCFALAIRMVYDFALTFLEMPMTALRVLQSPYSRDRVALNQYYTVGGTIGIGVGSVLFVPLVLAIGGSDGQGGIANPALGFFGAVAVFYAMFGCTLYLYYFNSRERVKSRHAGSEFRKDKLWPTLAALCRTKVWPVQVVFKFLNALCSMTIVATLSYFCQYVMGDLSWVPITMMAFLLGGLAVVPFAKPLAAKVTVRGLLIIAGLAFTVSKIAFVAAPEAISVLMANALLTGVAVALSNVGLGVYDAYVGDVVEMSYKKRADGMIFALGSFFRKSCYALTTFGITQWLAAAGFDAELVAQNDGALNVLKAMLGWVPLAPSILFLLIAWFFMVEKQAKQIHAAEGVAIAEA